MVPCCRVRGAAVNARAVGDATVRRGANSPAALSTALGAPSPALPSEGECPFPACTHREWVAVQTPRLPPGPHCRCPVAHVVPRVPSGAAGHAPRPGTAIPPGTLAPLLCVHSLWSGCSLQLGCRVSPAPPAAAHVQSHSRPPLYRQPPPGCVPALVLPHILSSTSFSPCPCVCQGPGFQGRSACWRGPSAPVPCFLLPFVGSLSWHISLWSHRQRLLVTA